MKRSHLLCGALLAVAVFVVSGCGGGDEIETFQVSGTVKLEGQPLDGADICFVGTDFAGYGTTDADGHFELQAQPGENTVNVSKFEGVSEEWDETMVPESDTGEDLGGPKQLVPEKYSDPLATELRFTVPDGGAENADFNLSSN